MKRALPGTPLTSFASWRLCVFSMFKGGFGTRWMHRLIPADAIPIEPSLNATSIALRLSPSLTLRVRRLRQSREAGLFDRAANALRGIALPCCGGEFGKYFVGCGEVLVNMSWLVT